jgi:hypothetical protein
VAFCAKDPSSAIDSAGETREYASIKRFIDGLKP